MQEGVKWGLPSELKWALARNAAVAPQPTECYADAYLAASVKGSLRQNMKVEMRQSREALAVLSLPGPGKADRLGRPTWR